MKPCLKHLFQRVKITSTRVGLSYDMGRMPGRKIKKKKRTKIKYKLFFSEMLVFWQFFYGLPQRVKGLRIMGYGLLIINY